MIITYRQRLKTRWPVVPFWLLILILHIHRDAKDAHQTVLWVLLSACFFSQSSSGHFRDDLKSGAEKPGRDGTFADKSVSRLARVVAADVPHHGTQRGNARQYILSSDGEKMVYMDLLRQAVQRMLTADCSSLTASCPLLHCIHGQNLVS
jgi:hypothetical protein